MELHFSSDKLIALRKLKGFSQEKLAEKAGINIRSLQRIEKQTVQPQPHTMGLLAEALGVSINDLCNEVAVETTETVSLRQLCLLHISAAAGLFFPFGNVLLPYLIWVYKMENSVTAKKHAQAVLNFQLSWMIYLFLLLTGYFTIEALAFVVFLIPIIILFNLIICPLVSGINVSRNKPFFYPGTITFFKLRA